MCCQFPSWTSSQDPNSNYIRWTTYLRKKETWWSPGRPSFGSLNACVLSLQSRPTDIPTALTPDPANTPIAHAVVQPHILSVVNMEGIKTLSHTSFLCVIFAPYLQCFAPAEQTAAAAPHLVSKWGYLVIPRSQTQAWITATCVCTHASYTGRFLRCVQHDERYRSKRDHSNASLTSNH